jgi:hypothetical protein
MLKNTGVKKCDKYYQLNCDFLVPKNSNYIQFIRDFIIIISSLTLLSLDKIGELIRFIVNAKPSTNTVKRLYWNVLDQK